MNTNQNKLALRRQSIRTLTADELRFAHGGQGDGTGNGPGHTTSSHWRSSMSTIIAQPGRQAHPDPDAAARQRRDRLARATVEEMEQVQVRKTVTETMKAELQSSTSIDSRAEKIRMARARGYEGDNCHECGNFTLVRNGTCLKCDTCGSTTGCS